MKKTKAKVSIPPNMRPAPFPHEVEAAIILSQHFNCNIEFLQPINSYKTKTPDFIMNGLAWELKCPQGKSKKRTLDLCLRHAKRQSSHIVIDTHRTKLNDDFITKHLRQQLHQRQDIKKIVMIDKQNSVIAIKK